MTDIVITSTADERFRSGFITILGTPNVGKSTLLNRMLGEKISITSKKPQTTRNRILGIVHRPDAQMVFIDTPGVHRTNALLNRRIVEVALGAITDADLVLLVVDVSASDPASEAVIMENVQRIDKPLVLALNKIDRVDHDHIMTAIARWSEGHDFAAIVPISAATGEQVDILLSQMEERLPDGPPYFPPDCITDSSERFLVGELIREKAVRLTGAEIPYALAVTVDRFKEQRPRQLIAIDATLHVERDSQKGIIIGKGGAKLKAIGEAARTDMERLLGSRVFLKLFVRVQKNWTRDTRALRRFGY